MCFINTIYGFLQSVGVVPPTPEFPTSGLTSYWSMDIVGGTTVYDSLGNIDGSVNNVRVLGSAGFNKNGADFTNGADYALFQDTNTVSYTHLTLPTKRIV